MISSTRYATHSTRICEGDLDSARQSVRGEARSGRSRHPVLPNTVSSSTSSFRNCSYPLSYCFQGKIVVKRNDQQTATWPRFIDMSYFGSSHTAT
jgi:hypothetical protein